MTTLAVPDDSDSQTALDAALSEIAGDQALSTEAFSERATRWLQERHAYSLGTSIPQGEGDPLVRWLASDRPGHCELFAGSFVLLARQAGYPARLVTGFRGGAWNGFENYYMVRNADAHAWVEIFNGKDRWLRVDPTPQAGVSGQAVEAGLGEGGRNGLFLDRTFGAYLDSLRVLWYRRIVNFDQRQQDEMFLGVRDRLREGWRNVREKLNAAWSALRDFVTGDWNWSRAWDLVPLLLWPAGLVLAVFAVRRFRARWTPRGRGEKRIRRRAGRWLQRVGALSVEGSAEPAAVVGDLLILRYDRPENWPPPENVFRRASQFRKQPKRKNAVPSSRSPS